MSEIEREFKIAEECLEEAKNLFSSGYYRGSVSRAYYSMYHAAKALLLTKNISPKTHAGVLRMLGLEFVNKNLLESTYSEVFQYAFTLRNEADYTPDTDISRERAEDVILSAESFLERIKRALIELGWKV